MVRVQPCGDLHSTLFRFLKARKFDVILAANMIESECSILQRSSEQAEGTSTVDLPMQVPTIPGSYVARPAGGWCFASN